MLFACHSVKYFEALHTNTLCVCVCVEGLLLLMRSLSLSLSLSLTSLRRDHFLLRSWPWKGLLNTCLRFKNVPHIDFLELHRKQAKRSKRRIKAKYCVFRLAARYGKMVWLMGYNTLDS